MPRSQREISLKKLAELWETYSLFRKGQIAPSTYLRDYQKITRRLEKMAKSAPYLETSIEIRDWLLENYSHETTRRTIQQFQACMRWAVDSELLDKSPFEGLPRMFRPKKPSEKAWAAFTADERDRIIQEFDVQAPVYSPWVKALFWTGARPEELCALRWEHLSSDCTECLFQEALPIDMREAQATKNYKSTRFPCNARLQRLFRELEQRDGRDRSSHVFKGVKGGRFDYHNFQTRAWKPLVSELVSKGKVAFYLSQYHARHTWITLALENGLSVQDVSYLARVSPKVIYDHYAGRSRRILIPEF